MCDDGREVVGRRKRKKRQMMKESITRITKTGNLREE